MGIDIGHLDPRRAKREGYSLKFRNSLWFVKDGEWLTTDGIHLNALIKYADEAEVVPTKPVCRCGDAENCLCLEPEAPEAPEVPEELDRRLRGDRSEPSKGSEPVEEKPEPTFKFGDRVKIARKLDPIGGLDWVSVMDYTLGEVGKVYDTAVDGGNIRVGICGSRTYCYHPASLELVDEEGPEPTPEPEYWSLDEHIPHGALWKDKDDTAPPTVISYSRVMEVARVEGLLERAVWCWPHKQFDPSEWKPCTVDSLGIG